MYSGGTVAQLSICSAKKFHKVDYPWTLRPFSKLVFSKEFKNVSLLWIRLERRDSTSRESKVKKGFLTVFEKVSNNCNVASGHAKHFTLVSSPMFLTWGIIWDHFCEPQIRLKAKNRVDGL